MASDSRRLTPTLIATAAAIEAALLLVRSADTPPQQVALVLVAYLIAGVAFAGLLWRIASETRRTWSRTQAAIVFGAAVIFRATLFPLAPATSGDVYRYLWEGLVWQAGYDPYQLAPNAPRLRDLAARHRDLWQRINHRDVAAIYPPTIQALFRINAAVFGATLAGWKCILLLFDALLCAILAVGLHRMRAPPVWLVGVLWCPLLLLECYEAGHLDLVGVALLVVAVVAYQIATGGPEREPRPRVRAAALVAAGVALGLSINVKYFWPLVVTVLLAARTRPRRAGAALAAVAFATAAAGWIPCRAGFAAARQTARMFAEHWTFNDVVFEALRALPTARWVPMAIVAGVLVLLALWLALRPGGDRGPDASATEPAGPWADVWLLCGTTLLLSPVAYPWYFLWIVPGLVFRPPLWLAVWVLGVPALHLVDLHYVRTGAWDPMPWLWWVVGLLPAMLLAEAWWRRLRRR